MPSFNQAHFVEAALKSVLSQDYEDKEILFIDGGSTDRTMQIVAEYHAQLDYCVSEQDRGQSDALHKGFSRATGDVLTWLNTDDLLLPGALRKAAKAFSEKPDRAWLLGNVVWIDTQDRILRCWRGDGYTPGLMRLGIFAAGGPSAFFTRELYERVGGLNLDLHYQMDTDLWWRFAMEGEAFYRIKGYTWALRIHENAKVSGSLFSSGTEAQLRALERRAVEHDFIQSATREYRKFETKQVSPALSVMRKLSSPSYLRGALEDKLYRGRKLWDLVPQ